MFFAVIALCYFAALIVAMPLAIHFTACLFLMMNENRKLSNYGLQVFTAWDQLLNVLLAPAFRWIFNYPVYDFGYADETISSVIGKNILRAPDLSDKSLFIVNTWLSKLDPISENHGVDSIEDDEGVI